MASKWYLEKLKNPRWQKMRLRVFERDDWRCRECNADDKCLHVHHIEYRSGKDPWEYPMDNFLTLCEACHQKESKERYTSKKARIKELKQLEKPLPQNIFDDPNLDEFDYLEMLTDIELEEREDRVMNLELHGADYDDNAHCWYLDGKAYDEDGNPL